MLAPDDSTQQSANGGPVAHGLPERTPDIIEQDSGDQLDNVVPTAGYGMLPVVGLGGSAGGLAALQEFFAAMPPESGMAFVVIMHLSPEHESILAELLQRSTAMPVLQVRDRVKVEANHVYVIPPARHLSLDDGSLSLSEISRRAGKHVAVDLFFRTLADTRGPHSAAIVLSGADGDGAIGIKRVKERGGLTIAQDPGEAEHDSMPRSSIATGMVDWVLTAGEMPAKLLEYWQTERRLRLPPEQGPQPASETADGGEESRSEGEEALRNILGLLRARTGHDFSYYKRATILRRVGRRMLVNGIEDTRSYLDFVRTHPGEPNALLQDLLISVTNFFRDRDSFAALEGMMPSLFRDKGPNDTVRVWTAACATGEEAYSVAILLCEYAGRLPDPPKIQVFATDLDENAIQDARDGTYPETISADVSEERLRRFFAKEHGGYRIKREVREVVLFALHDLLKDSPFSRLDLVTCRNLLIYLNPEAQARALDIFHFGLRAGGVLFLGSSESVDEGNPLFAVADKKRRIYVRQTAVRSGLPLFPGPGTLSRMLRARPAERLRTADAAPVESAAPVVPGTGVAAGGETVSWVQVHYNLIEQLAPPSVLVNQHHEILHLSEHAGRFLQVGGGEPTTNLLRMVHPMLRIELRAALYLATQTDAPVVTRGVPMEIDGVPREVNLRVAPLRSSASSILAVVFQEQNVATEPAATSGAPAGELEPATRQLERELEQSKLQLRDTVEQAEASDEELKASNEELQAMNEELRSATEELETGREELQSINEELSTVNQELKSKVDELGRSNSDLANLMAATQIATVFLDRQLCIQRYTSPAVAIFSLIPTDVGRPLSDLTPRLDYPGLAADAARVLEDLGTIEREVAHHDGRYFLARMLPYRTTDDHIAGVVLTFVDISRRREVEEELRTSEARFRAVADLVPDLLFSTGPAGQLTWCNRRWVTYTGQTLGQAQGHGWAETVHPEDRARVRRSFLAAVEQGQTFRSEHRLVNANGEARWFLVRAEPLRGQDGQIVQWFGAKTDVEDLKRSTADLAASKERLRLIIENAREFAIFSTDLELRITSWNPGAERLLGYAERKILGQNADVIFTPEDRTAGRPEEEARGALAHGRSADERWHQREDGSRFWGSGAMMRMNDAGGRAVGFVKILRDETEARQTRESLERSREELFQALQAAERAHAEAESASKAKDHFLAVLSHELRTPLTPVVMAVNMMGLDRNLSESAREALEMIERNVQIEAHFIDDLLDITKITRGKLEIVREPMDLHEAVRHAVEVTKADLEGKEQRITVELSAENPSVIGDATRLQQLFWNLLKNASKFTPPGGAIHVRSRDEPGRIVVEVADTGIGFEAEVANRIFEAFEQANLDVTRKFGGLGLGLAISKATADAHGGSLRAQSKGRDQGAIFTVELPLPEETTPAR